MRLTRAEATGLSARPPARGQPAGPWATVTIIVAGVAGGCTWDTPQASLVPRSDFARAIHGVYGVIAWTAVGIAVVVFAALAWVLLRDRGGPDTPLPPQTRGYTGSRSPGRSLPRSCSS